MSAFSGKVKKATSKKIDSGNGEFETIVWIGNDVNNLVETVKVTYPSEFEPSEDPVVCSYYDLQNGDKRFNNVTLTFNTSVYGETAKLFVSMVDANDNVLGTDSVNVTIEGSSL